MADLTVSLVVSGPGVKSSLFVVMREVLQFVGIAIEDVRQHDAAGRGVERRVEHALAADVGRVDHDVFNRIGSDLARVLAEDDEIGQLAGRDRTSGLFFERGVCAVERPNLDCFFDREALVDSVPTPFSPLRVTISWTRSSGSAAETVEFEWPAT
jgi:hypothetical protein